MSGAEQQAPASGAGARSVLSRPRAQVVCVVGAALAMGLFVRYFDFQVAQARIDGLWLVSLLLWLSAVFLQQPPERLPPVLRVRDLWPLGVLFPVFAACWLPFYDNWRWAYTGDSFGIFASGYWFGLKGPQQSLLSVHGIDNYYTYLWEVSYNWPMYLFGPTLFWHRVGQLIMACLALTAIYAYFSVVLGRLWATAIVVATATDYVWLWISYISYLRTDSFVFYYLTLLWGLLLWRNPRHLGLWAVCGLTGGLALFYTPVTWGAVLAVAVVCGVRAVLRGAFAGPLIYLFSFLLTATPILTELPWMIGMLRSQSVPQGVGPGMVLTEPGYFWRIFRTILLSAFDSPIHILGVNGGFLRWPLGHLYFVGVALAALAAVPPVRRRLRLPAVAPVLLLLFVWDAVLFTLTNKGYGVPSHKRFYNLIPLQVFFALLPFYAVYVWGASSRWLRGLSMTLLTASIVVSAVIGLRVIADPPPIMYGYNIFDGLIEIHQRFGDRDLVLLSRRQAEPDLCRDCLFDKIYGIAQRLSVIAEADRQTLDDACRRRALFCFEHTVDQDQARQLLKDDGRWTPFPLLNGTEIKCYDCTGYENAP